MTPYTLIRLLSILDITLTVYQIWILKKTNRQATECNPIINKLLTEITIPSHQILAATIYTQTILTFLFYATTIYMTKTDQSKFIYALIGMYIMMILFYIIKTIDYTKEADKCTQQKQN